MVINYSQTINKFTLLDAYPLPRMQDVVNNVTQYRVFSTLDLTSACHQVELPPSDRLYTAFQANVAFWQYIIIPFGLMNAVPCFQQIINNIIKENDCEAIFAHLDNITVCERNQSEHDRNVRVF